MGVTMRIHPLTGEAIGAVAAKQAVRPQLYQMQGTPAKRHADIKATYDAARDLSLIHISEPTRRHHVSRMPSSA